MRTFAIAIGVCAFLTTAAAAQSPQTTPWVSDSEWSVTAGRETVALRDVARTGVPVDGSPVAWSGSGVGLTIRYVRGRHLLTASAGRAGDFHYDSGLARVRRPETDSLRRVEGRYEYRRYLFTDLVLRGFDLGVGLQGGVVRSSLSRHVDGDIDISEARLSALATVVLAARYRPAARVTFDVTWGNGGHLSRSTEHHSVWPAASGTQRGGGWVTDLAASVGIDVSNRTAILVEYRLADDGLMSSHRNVTSRSHRVVAGVSYAR